MKFCMEAECNTKKWRGQLKKWTRLKKENNLKNEYNLENKDDLTIEDEKNM